MTQVKEYDVHGCTNAAKGMDGRELRVKRKGMNVDEVEKWLGPNLGYDV